MKISFISAEEAPDGSILYVRCQYLDGKVRERQYMTYDIACSYGLSPIEESDPENKIVLVGNETYQKLKNIKRILSEKRHKEAKKLREKGLTAKLVSSKF